MPRLHEEPKRHIHAVLVDEANDMSIRIKAHHLIKDAPQKLKDMHPAPSWEEVEKLIWKCVAEMNQCTVPFKKY